MTPTEDHMLCEECGEREAAVVVTTVINGGGEFGQGDTFTVQSYQRFLVRGRPGPGSGFGDVEPQ